jgi:hypothetical protein
MSDSQPHITYQHCACKVGRPTHLATNWSEKYHVALERLVRYLNGAGDYCLVVDAQEWPDVLAGYQDAD